MPAPLSVILPTANSAARLSDTCAALMEGVYQGLIAELLVVDAGSRDDTIPVAKALGAEIITWRPGGASQLLAGRQVAKGRWHLIVKPGEVLQPGWASAVERFLEVHPDRSGYFRQIGPGSVWLNARARLIGTAGQLHPAKGARGSARAIAADIRRS